ncbi:MAG TPA: hypothetical protein VM802_07020 [Chitinophaga sp.]|uniref:hypothetical protein n=1 Tax=Chitinophaga sp. TaxID=1869181 RepID=UPI002C7D9790|nr:hypothetical protein [Chitinophaga sp.]HVI44601.1 hypothetical protein [Chitinophaga sp.]
MMSIELIELKHDEHGTPVGVFIPFRYWGVLRHTVRAYTPIFDLMDRYGRPKIWEFVEKQHGPVNYLEMQMKSELAFIQKFARGEAIYVEDERCPSKPHFVRHNPDGSEDLISRDWEKETDVLVRQLTPAGQGVYAFLLKDPRYERIKARHKDQHTKDGEASST